MALNKKWIRKSGFKTKFENKSTKGASLYGDNAWVHGWTWQFTEVYTQNCIEM